MLALDTESAWKPPIVLTEAMRGENVPELWEKIEEHRAFLESDGLLEQRRRENLAGEVFAVASARAKAHLRARGRGRPELRRLLDEVQSRKLDPLTAVREIMEKVFKVGDEDGTDARADIEEARGAARGHRARDAGLRLRDALAARSGARSSLKAENLQRTGSFKIRGAVNKIATLARRRAARRRRRGQRGQPRPGGGLGGARGRRQGDASSCRRTRRWRRSSRRRTTARRSSSRAASFEDALAAALRARRDDRRHLRPSLRGRARDRRARARSGSSSPSRCRTSRRSSIPVGGGGLAVGNRARAAVASRPDVRIVGVQAGLDGSTIADGIAVKQVGELTGAILDERARRPRHASPTTRSAARSCCCSSARSSSSRARARSASPRSSPARPAAQGPARCASSPAATSTRRC